MLGAAALLAAAAPAAAVPDGYVRMPGGRLHHRSCVHAWHHPVHVHSDGSVRHPNGTVTRFGPCPYPPLAAPRGGAVADGAGAANASYPMGYVMMAEPSFKSIGSWSADWVVPPAPSHPSGIVYLFNGLQPGNNIYQPVLQWGGSCHGTSSWTFVSYFVGGDGRSQCGSQVKVHPGDTIRGVMKRTSGGWQVISSDLTTGGTPSSITSNHGDPTWGDLALEMYSSGSCTSYPNNDGVTFTRNEFTSTSGAKLTPTWKNGRPGGSCSNSVKVIDAATVKLAWKGPSVPTPPPPPPPAPVPPDAARYHCDTGSSLCIVAVAGHSTVDTCLAACGNAPASPRFHCDTASRQCIVQADGHSTVATCLAACQPQEP